MFPFLLIFAIFFQGPVSVLVRPNFAIAPGSFQATIVIERSADNRQLEYGYRKGDFTEWSSRLSLDGTMGPRVFYPRPWEQLPGGDYIAYAELTRVSHGKTTISYTEQAFRSIYPDDF